jgi:DNA invertase Pin-like site-specific DNA recombinase
LELASGFNVLIGDEDGLYDPSDFNDRLLLGLKGTFSEIERYQITARMQRGRLNKARRGEYAKPVPIGYAYDPFTGQLQLSPTRRCATRSSRSCTCSASWVPCVACCCA